MKCNAAPYEGTDKYIFVSYCHKDKAKVYPYIELMAREGYRIWYDEGINPGTEWPETIAEKLSGAEFFLAFITEASLASHNCRREINFAIQKKKTFTACFLEDVNLTLGMEMVLSTVQGIYQEKYASRKECLEKIYKNVVLRHCRGEKNYNILISEYEPVIKKEEKVETQEIDLYKRIFLDNSDEIKENKDSESKHSLDVLLIDKQNEKKEVTWAPILYRVEDCEIISLNHFPFSIGRKKGLADYVIEDNKSVSRKHASITMEDHSLGIIDHGSLNGVLVNGEKIAKDKKVKLEFGNMISIGEVEFVCLPAQIKKGNLDEEVFLLENKAIQYVIRANDTIIRVGRVASKNDFVIKDKSISRMHSLLVAYGQNVGVVDLHSQNGTFINGKKVKSGELSVLPIGAKIAFSETELTLKLIEPNQ